MWHCIEIVYRFTFSLSNLIIDADALSLGRYQTPKIFSCESVSAPYYFYLILLLTEMPWVLTIIGKFIISSLFHFFVLSHLTLTI